MPAAGGEETRVVPSIQSRAFAVTDGGIYFISPAKRGTIGSIDFLSFTSSCPKNASAAYALAGHGFDGIGRQQVSLVHPVRPSRRRSHAHRELSLGLLYATRESMP